MRRRIVRDVVEKSITDQRKKNSRRDFYKRILNGDSSFACAAFSTERYPGKNRYEIYPSERPLTRHACTPSANPPLVMPQYHDIEETPYDESEYSADERDHCLNYNAQNSAHAEFCFCVSRFFVE